MGEALSEFNERFREREADSYDIYDNFLAKQQKRLKRAHTGDIVMRKSAVPTELSRQGHLRFYLNSMENEGDATTASATQDWDVFIHEVRSESGMHRHQGGLVIYVVKGLGYTTIEGKRLDWKTGDLLLLPVIPGGVAHQHFNLDSEPSEWIAFIFRPMHDAVGSYAEQVKEAPEFINS